MSKKAGLLRLQCLVLFAITACGDDSDPKGPSDEQEASTSDTSTAPAPGDAAAPNDIDAAQSDAARPMEAGTGVSSDSAAPVGDGGAVEPGRDGGSSADLDAGANDARIDAPSDAGDTSSDGGVSADDAGLDAASSEDAALQDAQVVADAADEDGSFSDGGSDAGATCSAATPPNVGVLGLRTVISSPELAGLTDAVQPPGSDDWFLVEQRGRVMVLRAGQTTLEPTPFLDLTTEIGLPNAGSYEDRGLFSIAFAPDYATSGVFYVSVTPDRMAYRNVDLLLRYTRSAGNAYAADPASRSIILEVRGSRLGSSDARITDNIHNGGRVTFGPDGMLYLAMGDGGGIQCGDVEPNATQDVSSPFGKMLRLDVSQPAPHGAVDNPFVNGGDPRVLHYGLRNPFRFSFDRLTGDLYLGDVGQNRYEEISYAPRGAAGLNFGWAPFEGNTNTCTTRQLRAGSTHTPPILSIDRRGSATGPFADYQAVIGGVVYRGQQIPRLSGAYLFGGYTGRRIGALYQCGANTSAATPVLKACDTNEPNAACLRRLDGGPAFRELRAIVEDNQGEVYFVANGNSLLQLVPAP
jgi:glucose/arabinose dehydrogenase